MVGCMDPGHDGVGDYTRQLAVVCKEKNHEVFVISLLDRGIKAPLFEEQNGIRVLRLPNAINNSEEQNAVFSWIHKFQPDWISIQFVCYSFHPKGICYKFTYIVKKMQSIARIHIMAHELWIGPHQKAPIKEKLIGLLQRYFIKKIFKEASCFHTQCDAYQFLLKKNGFNAKLLPLFSNINVIKKENNRSDFLEEFNKKNAIILSFFGSLYRGFPVEKIVERLNQISKITNKKILIISLGNLGASVNLWEDFTKACGDNIQAVRIYPLQDDELSNLLQEINFGIVTTPLSILDKSGAAAAFRAHEVPILYIRDDVHFKGFEVQNPCEAISFYENFYENKSSFKKQQSHPSDAYAIVDQFLNDLK